jgi:hypothetical protein
VFKIEKAEMSLAFLNGRKKCRSTLPLSARRPILSGIFIPAMPIQGKKKYFAESYVHFKLRNFEKIKKGEQQKKIFRLISS